MVDPGVHIFVEHVEAALVEVEELAEAVEEAVEAGGVTVIMSVFSLRQ